jgi:hypothetical protein
VQLERVAAMQRTLSQALPDALAAACRVAYETGGCIVIEAQNGAAAAKVKALSGRLLAALRQHDQALTAIRVEVVVVRRIRAGREPVRRIGPTGMRSLSALAGSLPEGPVQAALRRLLRASNREDQALEDQKRQHHRSHDQGVLEDLPSHAQPAPVLRDQVQGDRSADRQHDQEADDA